jgi:hypothetical protein
LVGLYTPFSASTDAPKEDRTVLSGLVQLGCYLGASVGVTILNGILSEVSQISSAVQFLGVFGLLIAIYGVGLANECYNQKHHLTGDLSLMGYHPFAPKTH